MQSPEQDNYIYLPLMTISEAAKYLGVGRRIVYQLIEYDQIKAVKDKRTIRIEKRSLDEFSNSGIMP